MHKQLRKFLDKNNIRYDLIKTEPLIQITRERLNTAKMPEKGLAKSIVVRTDGKLAMLVEPILAETDLNRWKELIKCNDIEIVTDKELTKLFGNIEMEAVPAVGNLFNMEVFLDDTLSLDEDITFTSGETTELVKLAYNDYVKWVKPKLFHIH